MAEIWIQLENRPWDTMPNNIDRMTGRNAQTITGLASEVVTITSPDAAGSGVRVSHTRRMYAPLRDSAGKVTDALIYRRYKAPDPAAGIAEWQVPDDRKINPWDINEKDPTDMGTMGTIPGPVVECNVGDEVKVHFRNLDMRLTKAVKARAHSLHVHGFVFKQEHDGAYPLSNADVNQRVDGTTPVPGQIAAPNETALWNGVAPGTGISFGTFKKGDRVPPGGTFVYNWTTQGWPSTAGVWLYHDHSFCDDKNMGLGAIGMVVIHNPADTENDFTVSNADFPDGSATGNPLAVTCRLFPFDVLVDPSFLQKLGVVDPHLLDQINPAGPHEMNMGTTAASRPAKAKPSAGHAVAEAEAAKAMVKTFRPELLKVVQEGNVLFHLNNEFTAIRGLCTSFYKAPPAHAIYLQLFHKLTGSPGMNINGRTYLGNTPSVVAGTTTKMRFGVVGMGQSGDVHTFHIHGHRWTMPGPDGNTPTAIQSSAQIKATSQFEDTRIFGPANSFGFTINGAVGSFMRAGGRFPDDSKGEWHMHCHFLDHMMSGMMGSLLIVSKDQQAIFPAGELCPEEDVTPAATVIVKNFEFAPKDISVPSGTVVTFNFVDTFHSVTTVTKTGTINPIEINGGPGGNLAANKTTPVPIGTRTITMTGSMGDRIDFQCGIHTTAMPGSITISM
jgi:FtsP/CotA-like multicopper oxidase with cupredoxin domain